MNTILQVEDDPNDVFFLKRAMTKLGVANPVQIASNGQQAMDYLKGNGKFADRERFPLPCVVLLDLKLPYVMGLEILKWIRLELSRSLVVIILTASAEEADIATAYRLGANAFLTKPSEANKLEDMVKAIRDFWLTYNTLPRQPLPCIIPDPAVAVDFAPNTPPAVNGKTLKPLPLRTKRWANDKPPRLPALTGNGVHKAEEIHARR